MLFLENNVVYGCLIRDKTELHCDHPDYVFVREKPNRPGRHKYHFDQPGPRYIILWQKRDEVSEPMEVAIMGWCTVPPRAKPTPERTKPSRVISEPFSQSQPFSGFANDP